MSNLRPITAVELLRPPQNPGGPAWIRADNGGYYVIKGNYELNPQRAANECVANRLAEIVGVTTPQHDLVDVWSLKDEHSELAAGIQGGVAFGSRLPSTKSLFDMAPRSLIGRVENLDELWRWHIFDAWVCNAKPLQAVFCAADGVVAEPGSIRAFKISHAKAFHGFRDREFLLESERSTDRYAANAELAPVESVAMLVEGIRSVTSESLQCLLVGIPPAILDRGYGELLIEGLLRRAKDLPKLLPLALRHQQTLFCA